MTRVEEALAQADKPKIQDHIVSASKSIIDFKRERLSILNKENPMAIKIGFSEHYASLKAFLLSIDQNEVFKPKSAGFCYMSEVWLRGDYEQHLPPKDDAVTTKKVLELAAPVIDDIRAAVSAIVGKETVVFRSYIDTIDDTSCIIPHSDGFLHHRLGFRVHVPLFTSPRSYGVNFHPYTTQPRFWQMKEEGSIVVFNNFEPHTVTKLEDGMKLRSHLICDIGIKSCVDGLSELDALAAKAMILGYGVGTTLSYSPNLITHSISNRDFRNRLGMHYGGMHPNETLEEQLADEYVKATRSWIKKLFEQAESQKLIEQIS